MLKIAVLVSGGGTNLQAIIDNIKNGSITNARIAKVISNKKDAYALKRAEKEGLEAVCIKRKDYKTNSEFNLAMIEELKESEVELVVLAGFLCILSEDFIKAFKNRIINIHPSLIPAFCGNGYYGLKVHEKALERGVKITGATVHIVDELTDHGPILYQKSVVILDTDTAESLQKRVMKEAEWELLPLAIKEFSKWSKQYS